jgi:hypothetical protein
MMEPIVMGCFALALFPVVYPMVFRPKTDAWRRWFRAAWISLPLMIFAWYGFLWIDPALPGWIYFSCLGIVVAVTAVCIFSSTHCQMEKWRFEGERPVEVAFRRQHDRD